MKLEFGTAGIRGIVGPNDNQLNEAHAAMIFDAYAKYINKNFNDVKNKIVVIGRDNRIKGKVFCTIAFNILTQNGIKVVFNKKMVATPFISFLIKHKKAIGGINITASHNPKEYNGIKLYNQHGYQILPNEVNEIKKYFQPYENYKKYINSNVKFKSSKLVLPIEKSDLDFYIKKVLSINEKKIDISNIKIVYSSLHGTGFQYVEKIFKKLKANIFYEKNEIKEDENFSYVKNPNPEYEIAFENCIKLANEKNADLIIVTDPDSDRVGVAYKKNNEFKLINGNENAILITDFLLDNKKIQKNKEYYLVHSFVSTSLPAKMCQLKNIKTYITETGFKWIGQKIDSLKTKENFFFAFEESYGSLVNEKLSLDKDAIQSVLMISLIASLAKKQNMNLEDKLDAIYKKYGYMSAKAFSFDLKDLSQLKKLKNDFKSIKFKDANFFDYSKGIRNIEPNEMLSYEFKNSSNWVALRPSGTEPKFKIYIHVVEESKEKSNQVFDQIYKIVKTKLSI